MTSVQTNVHLDQFWQGRKVICRQYLQGFCSYGSRCKYDHPQNGEWFDSQPLPTTPCFQAHGNRGYWLSSHEGQCNDSNWYSHHAYSASESIPRESMSSYNSKQSHQQSAPRNVDPKKMRSIIAWKTTPCKHFIKNSGWCPLGDSCNFIHDWQLVYSNMWNQDIIRQTAESSSRPDGSQKATSHCWAHVQGYCGASNCPHFHPADIQPYIKYTPCPAWLLCDKRDTCPFKHFDAVPNSQVPERSVAPPVIAAPGSTPIYYPEQIQPAVGYTTAACTYPRPNPVEVCGTTYFPYAQSQNVAMEGEYGYSMPAPVPVPVPVPMAAPVPILLPLQFPIEMPLPTSPPPSYHYVPQENCFHNEYSTLVPSYVIEHSESHQALRPASEPISGILPLEDSGTWLAHPDSGSYPGSVQGMGILPEAEQLVTNLNSAGANSPDDVEDERKNRKCGGHVRRISVNLKTGEVVERSPEGRHGVYGL